MPKKDAFKNKVVWITGASSGIGEALSYELAKHGAKLVLSARRGDLLTEVAKKCKTEGSPAVEVMTLDLKDFASHNNVAAQVVERFKRIDYLVNNAARFQQGFAEKTDLVVSREILETNILGTVSVTKAVLPYMLNQPDGGVIVVTSSLLGKMGSATHAIYTASKFALHGYFESLRMELANRKIHTVTICPGPTASEIFTHACTEHSGDKSGIPTDMKGFMPAARVAKVSAAAMWARLPEVWISVQPYLLVTYIAQYCRGLYEVMGASMGPKSVEQPETLRETSR